MNIYEISTKADNPVIRAGGWRCRTEKDLGPQGSSDIEVDPGSSSGWNVFLSPPPHSWFTHTQVLLKSVSVLQFNWHAVGGVWLLLVPRGCLAGWVWREPRADSYLTFSGRGPNDSQVVLGGECQLAWCHINTQQW